MDSNIILYSVVNKKYRKSNSTSYLLGLALLVVGLGSGIILVTQPQLLEPKAQVPPYTSCPSNYDLSICKEVSRITELHCIGGKSCTSVFSTVSCPNPKCNSMITVQDTCIIDLICVPHNGKICRSDTECVLRLGDKRATCTTTNGGNKWCTLIK